MKEGNDIDEHSEKVRKILGSMPRGVIGWGIAVLCVIFMALILAVMCVDYPYGEGESIFRHIFNYR